MLSVFLVDDSVLTDELGQTKTILLSPVAVFDDLTECSAQTCRCPGERNRGRCYWERLHALRAHRGRVVLLRFRYLGDFVIVVIVIETRSHSLSRDVGTEHFVHAISDRQRPGLVISSMIRGHDGEMIQTP